MSVYTNPDLADFLWFLCNDDDRQTEVKALVKMKKKLMLLMVYLRFVCKGCGLQCEEIRLIKKKSLIEHFIFDH